MKRTLLTSRDSAILEEALAKFGNIVTTRDLYSILKDASKAQALNIISRLAKRGWLVRIKHGTYSIADLTSRGYLDASQLVVAQTICSNSYVTMEAALGYHGMFDQLLSTITSVSLAQIRTTNSGSSNYHYISTQNHFFYGFDEVTIEGKQVKIATIEKALIDLIQFNRSIYSVDLVIEKMQTYKDKINFNRLASYLEKSTTATTRIFGYIFDLLGIKSSSLDNIVKEDTSTTYLSKDSGVYQAKWRLYIDKYFDKYSQSA